MQSTLGVSLQACLETVRGIAESYLQSSRVLGSCNGEWVGTPSKSDFASSLMQEISKRVIKFVSQSGKSCFASSVCKYSKAVEYVQQWISTHTHRHSWSEWHQACVSILVH